MKKQSQFGEHLNRRKCIRRKGLYQNTLISGAKKQSQFKACAKQSWCDPAGFTPARPNISRPARMKVCVSSDNEDCPPYKFFFTFSVFFQEFQSTIRPPASLSLIEYRICLYRGKDNGRKPEKTSSVSDGIIATYEKNGKSANFLSYEPGVFYHSIVEHLFFDRAK